LRSSIEFDLVRFMPDPHPIELRLRVVHAYEAGEGTYPEIGQRFAVGEASVRRWVKQSRERGTLDPLPRGGGTPSEITAGDLSILLAALPDGNAGELTAVYNRRRRGQARVHVSSLKRALRRHGYVVKKSASGRWSNSGPM
jgi:transposase